jgi:cation transport regulator
MPPENLPAGAKEIYKSAEANARKTTCKDRKDKDECAAKIAWSAVKRKYRKDADGNWVPKAEVQEFSMAIVKASYHKATSTRRWKATASDTDEDSYKDSMSLELFEDFLHRIETKELPPEDFRSDFWSGGKPYLSVSHYPDLNGKGVPGPVDAIYIDGRIEVGRGKLKANGRFDDTPIGRACFDAVCRDLYSEGDPIPDDERIRISIAFLDYKHRHKATDYTFERSEDDTLCPECLKELVTGEYEGKEFLRGHLIHLGMTRVPVNKRTDMEVERSMTTRKEDAESIIGEELAEELEEETKAVGKSEALVVKSDEESLEEKANKKKDMDDEEEEDEKKKKKDEKKSTALEVTLNASDFMRVLEEIKSEINVEKPEAHPLDEAIATLKAVYDQAVVMEDVQVALQTIQEPFELLGRSIQESFVREEPQTETSGDISEFQKMLAEFKSGIDQEFALLRAEISATKTEIPEQVQIPERRSINPQLIRGQPAEAESKTPKLKAIIDRSVGL